MYEVGKIYDNGKFKISIEELSYVENEEILDEFQFSVTDNQYKYTVEGYAIDTEESDSYTICVYDTTDDNTLDTYNRVCTAYYDSCGGSEADCSIKVFDITEEQREDFEKVIETVLFDTNGIIIPF